MIPGIISMGGRVDTKKHRGIMNIWYEMCVILRINFCDIGTQAR